MRSWCYEGPMSRPFLCLALPLVVSGCDVDETVNARFVLGGPPETAAWSQWGGDARHGSRASVVAQDLGRARASVTFDPFVAEEREEAGDDVLIHYQAPLLDGDDV